MKAMILAAGLGTRLQPFTLTHPKALYEVSGQTLLKIAIGHLKSNGISTIIVNVHHFADQIVNYLELNHNFGCSISFSDETGELLETGGGVKKAGWFFDANEDFVIRNVDILSDLDLRKMTAYHKKQRSLATLAVRDRKTSRYFIFDNRFRLCGWTNHKTGEKKMVGHPEIIEETSKADGFKNVYMEMAFSGIQVINSSLLPLMTEQGAFSLTQLYLRLASQYSIYGYLEDGQLWADIGAYPK
jgi:NDP-sugar pyrophosphorylase family protein